VSVRRNARRLGRRLPAPIRRVIQAAQPSAPAPAPSRPPPAAPRPEPPAEAPPREALLRALARGEPIESAIVAQVHALNSSGAPDTARALAESLRARPETEELGHLAAGIVASRRGYRALAWDELHTVSRETWSRLAAAEYVRSGLTVAPDEALRELRALVEAAPDDVRARQWYAITTALWGYGAGELARDAFAVFDRCVDADPDTWEPARAHRAWLRPWIAATPDSPTAPAPGRPVFAIMDYGHPSPTKASANIGDHIQSIAALGHVTRHQGVRFHGRDELVELVDQLRGSTRAARRRTDVDADVEVMTVHRDASPYEPIPEPTWTLAFGWFMHALFHMRHAFPLHDNLRPLFVSFHCNKRELLTPAAIAYLRRYGPVGCRDWTTVDLLLSIGVPAFFSGCLTTTIDTVFPELAEPPAPGAPLAYVDMPADTVPADAVTYKHSREAVRQSPFVANVRTALELLDTYRREHRGVVTSRLHCYLPVRSLGVDVDFRPKNRADVRFDGLIDIDDAAFDAIRTGLDDKLERVVGAIFSGTPEADVYALWRELNAADVAAAEARHARPAELAPVAGAVLEPVRAAAAEARPHGPAPAADAVQLAVIAPPDSGLGLAVLAASALEHASRPLHLWVLARAGAEPVEAELAERFPQLSFTWLPTRGLVKRLASPSGDRPGAAGVLRLLLGELLPGADRVVLLGLPSVALGDIAELADLDLGGHLLAAPTRPGTIDASGFGVIHAAAARLGDRTAAAAALRRTAHARHAFDFDAFDDHVLVLDLAAMRTTGFAEQALPLVETYGLDGLEALHFLAGPDRAVVPARWSTVPTRSPARDPALLHWADAVKPRRGTLTPQRERWRRYAAAYADADG